MDKTIKNCDEALTEKLTRTQCLGPSHSDISVYECTRLYFKITHYLFKFLGFVLLCPFQEVQQDNVTENRTLQIQIIKVG